MTGTPAILGGAPLRTQPFSKRSTMGEAEQAAVRSVLEADVLSAFLGSAGAYFLGGPRVKAFEQAWKDAYGYEHCITVSSWTAGLMVAMGAAGVQPGDEVIVPPYTMSASATAAMFYGGIPIFADIHPDTFNIDPAAFEAAITPRTRAVVVVHLFGRPADMDPICAIAKRHGIKVIEDGAQAPAALYKGRPVGDIGDIGGFSLNYHKHVHTGEGGVLVTRDPQMARISQLIRNHGENAVSDEEAETLPNFVGSNYRLTELQAAVGEAQLERLNGYVSHRQRLGAHLSGRLRDLPGLTVQELDEGTTHAWYLYPFRYDADVVGLSRKRFVEAVCAEMPEPDGFEVTPLTEGYIKPLYLSSAYQKKRALGRDGYPWAFNPDIDYQYPKGLCPVTERMYERELILTPLLREPLTEADMDDLADAIERVITNASAIADKLGRGEDRGEVYTPIDAANATSTR